MKSISYLIIALLLTSFTQKDASELVKVLYGESGSNYRDAWYVCQVIKNRKTEWDYKNLRDVVSSRKQFNGYKKRTECRQCIFSIAKKQEICIIVSWILN